MTRTAIVLACALAPATALAEDPPAPAVADPDAADPSDLVAASRLGLATGVGDPWPVDRASPPAAADGALRPLSIDDTPTTIDVGHVQAEIDLAVVGYDRGDGARTVTTQVMPTRLRLGLARRLEAQLVVVPYAAASTQVDGAETREGGYGSTYGRLKLNLWGNDGGETAAALVPFVGRTGDAWSAGLAIAGTVELGAGLVFGVVPQVEVGADGATATTTANVSRVVAGPVIAIAETAGRIDTLGSPWALQATGAVAVGVTDDAEIDAGVRRGVTGPVPDVEGFLRVSVRR
ncbi:MAG: hypothetical protein IPH44_23570 [Myxococcales bacterium]|nr:hypothetical protein [Myxococcales bacterium]MBK7195975.1 hypothetical protein [Myxococcales bacterium]